MLYFAMMQSLDEAERRKGKKIDADEEKEELKVEKEVYKKEKEVHSTSSKRIMKRKEKEVAEEKAHNYEGHESAERGFKRERVQRKRSGKNYNNNSSSSFINEENSLKMISHDLIDSSFSSSFSPSITVLTMSLFKYLAIV